MVRAIYLKENDPYPNNALPVLYFENVLDDALGNDYTGDDILQLFKNNGYTDGWKNGILNRHHFHSTAHEALACARGEVRVQLGGQNGEMLTFRKGDVLLLPAGTAHKKLDATLKHEIIGAYPLNDSAYDFQYGKASDYKAIKENVTHVNLPKTDPLTGSPKLIQEYWQL